MGNMHAKLWMLNEKKMNNMKNILIIAPHPDDEILGCGATMAKLAKQGHNVYVLIATNASVGAPELFGAEIVRQARSEALEAHKILGVKETTFLEFPAPVLDQYARYKMSNEISAVIKKYGINIVYLPHRGDCHIDHKIIHECAMVACRPLANSTVEAVYAYETLSETEWGESVASEVFVPTRFVTFSETEFEIKLKAMACFKSQLYQFPASRSLEAIEALAKYRGATVSRMRAECFEVLREIE